MFAINARNLQQIISLVFVILQNSRYTYNIYGIIQYLFNYQLYSNGRQFSAASGGGWSSHSLFVLAVLLCHSSFPSAGSPRHPGPATRALLRKLQHDRQNGQAEFPFKNVGKIRKGFRVRDFFMTHSAAQAL